MVCSVTCLKIYSSDVHNYCTSKSCLCVQGITTRQTSLNHDYEIDGHRPCGEWQGVESGKSDINETVANLVWEDFGDSYYDSMSLSMQLNTYISTDMQQVQMKRSKL